jgi:hypothetical protein
MLSEESKESEESSSPHISDVDLLIVGSMFSKTSFLLSRQSVTISEVILVEESLPFNKGVRLK